jgi:hypothetical protein
MDLDQKVRGYCTSCRHYWKNHGDPIPAWLNVSHLPARSTALPARREPAPSVPAMAARELGVAAPYGGSSIGGGAAATTTQTRGSSTSNTSPNAKPENISTGAKLFPTGKSVSVQQTICDHYARCEGVKASGKCCGCADNRHFPMILKGRVDRYCASCSHYFTTNPLRSWQTIEPEIPQKEKTDVKAPYPYAAKPVKLSSSENLTSTHKRMYDRGPMYGTPDLLDAAVVKRWDIRASCWYDEPLYVPKGEKPCKYFSEHPGARSVIRAVRASAREQYDRVALPDYSQMFDNGPLYDRAPQLDQHRQRKPALVKRKPVASRSWKGSTTGGRKDEMRFEVKQPESGSTDSRDRSGAEMTTDGWGNHNASTVSYPDENQEAKIHDEGPRPMKPRLKVPADNPRPEPETKEEEEEENSIVARLAGGKGKGKSQTDTPGKETRQEPQDLERKKYSGLRYGKPKFQVEPC